MTTADCTREARAFTVQLDAQECAYLLNMLKTELGDTRVEARRTDTPDFREGLHRQEDMILRLLAKLQACGQSGHSEARASGYHP
jgi:hypothetical protein